MRTPHAIHAGFPKCASTFIQSWLCQHPDVFMVFKGKFLSPFEHPRSAWSTEAEYLSRFSDAAANQCLVESDEHLLMPLFHPCLGIHAITRKSTEEVFKRMAGFAPDAGLIIVIRNQTDMIISAYSQYVLAGGTLRMDDFANELLCSSSDGQNHYCMFFDEVIEQASAHYHDRMLVLLLEDFRNDQAAQLAKLSEFLNLPACTYRDSFKARRVGLSANAMRLTRRLNQLLVRGKRGSVQDRYWIPMSGYRFLCNSLRVIDYYLLSHVFRASKEDLLGKETRQRIEVTFGPDNIRLSRRLRRDLESLGYACLPAQSAATETGSDKTGVAVS